MVLLVLGDFLICLWPDAQEADLGPGVQWAAGASFWNPNLQPFPGREAGHREGVSFPTSPGWLPPDLGHQSPVLQPHALSLTSVCSRGIFFKCMNVWENLHVGTISYLHLWLFMKSQNCGENREPQRCQDTLGKVVCSPLAVPSASFWRAPRGTWLSSSSVLNHRALRVLVTPAPARTLPCILSQSPLGNCVSLDVVEGPCRTLTLSREVAPTTVLGPWS